MPTGKNLADLYTRGAALDKLLESHSGGMDQSGYCQRVRLSHPASLRELKTSDRKEGNEDAANVPTCRQWVCRLED